MEQNSPELPEENPLVEKKAKKINKNRAWTIIGIIAAVLVVVGGAGGGYLIHLSDTSPQFCGTCHIMDPNVDSYLSSNDMDFLHFKAGVQCKECHDYPVPAEVASGIKFITGNYEVDAEGKLMPVTYDNDMCLKCHISYDFIAESTAHLSRNPHDSHNGQMACKTCHVSHGDQIDFCSQCHDNGGQMMVSQKLADVGLTE